MNFYYDNKLSDSSRKISSEVFLSFRGIFFRELITSDKILLQQHSFKVKEEMKL